MSDVMKPTQAELEEGAKRLYHHVVCPQMDGLKIRLTVRRRQNWLVSAIGQARLNKIVLEYRHSMRTTLSRRQHGWH